jgi:imidazole glycerol phosphate synthase glutamine amidotransferase subunit
MAGLRRAGAVPRLSQDAADVRRAERVVLPGVGAFGAGMSRLREASLVDAIVERIAADKPLLAVCLGLQLMCRRSEESPGVEGIGIIDATVTRFRGAALRIPQLGWNRVEPEPGCRLLEPGYAYYANTFRLEQIPDDFAGARSTHGAPFVAALERGALLMCQFHPELSSGWGHALLSRWLKGASC